MNSSLKRMWQKFFLLLRMAVISPHRSNTSLMMSSVAFSGKPPTNTVLQPGGRSRVDGGGRSATQRHYCIIKSYLPGYIELDANKSLCTVVYGVSLSASLNEAPEPRHRLKQTFCFQNLKSNLWLWCHSEGAVGYLLGFWGNRVQLVQWMISLMTGTSGGTGGGGTRLIPAIMGLIGAMRPRPGSNLWMHRGSVGQSRKKENIKKIG